MKKILTSINLLWIKSKIFQEMMMDKNRTSFHLIMRNTSALKAVFFIRILINKIKNMIVLPNYTIRNQYQVSHQVSHGSTFATVNRAWHWHNAKKTASYADPILETADLTNATKIAVLLNGRPLKWFRVNFLQIRILSMKEPKKPKIHKLPKGVQLATVRPALDNSNYHQEEKIRNLLWVKMEF